MSARGRMMMGGCVRSFIAVAAVPCNMGFRWGPDVTAGFRGGLGTSHPAAASPSKVLLS